MPFCYKYAFDPVQANDPPLLFFSGKLSEKDEALISSAVSSGVCFAVLRGYPNERGGYIDPLTLEAGYAENDAFAIDRDLYLSLDGLDRRFGRAAATDLLCRAKQEGVKARYLPDIRCPSKEQPPSFLDRASGTLLLRARYGTKQEVLEGLALLLKALKHPSVYGSPRFATLFQLLRLLPSLTGIRLFEKRPMTPPPLRFREEDSKEKRGDIHTAAPLTPALVSVLIRTRNRPEVFSRCLASLRHQTYRNLEVIVLEDGEPLCREIAEAYQDFPLRYRATRVNVGRGKALNLCLEMAAGTYCNLLDDDDFLMPEHIELALGKLHHEKKELLFCDSFARYPDDSIRLIHFPHIDPFEMAKTCVAASCGVLFQKSLYDRLGGTKAALFANEDWYLWQKYMSANSYTTLRYVTSVFSAAEHKDEQNRRADYRRCDALLYKEPVAYRLYADDLRAFERHTRDGFDFLETLGVLTDHLLSEHAKIEDTATAEETYRRLSSVRESEITVNTAELKQYYEGMLLSRMHERKPH